MPSASKKTAKNKVKIEDLPQRQRKAEVADDQAEKVKGGDGSTTGGTPSRLARNCAAQES
jgi:hypothetical protein